MTAEPAPTAGPPLTVVIREALAGLAAGRWLTWVMIVAPMLVVAVALIADALSTQSAIDDEYALRAAGGYVLAIGVDETGAQPPAASLHLSDCEHLRRLSSSSAAGGYGVSTDTTLATATDQDVGLTDMSAGMTEVVVSLDGRPIGPDAFIADTAATEALGVASGQRLALVDTEPRPVVVRSLEPLAPGLANAVLSTANPNRVARRCFVAFADRTERPTEGVIAAAIGVPDLVIRSANPATDLVEDPQTRFDGRAGRYSPIGAAVLALLLGTLLRWTRRGERALYRTIGVGHHEVRLIYVAQAAATTVIGGGAGLLVGLATLRVLDTSAEAVGVSVITAVGSLLAFAVVSAGVELPNAADHTLNRLKDR